MLVSFEREKMSKCISQQAAFSQKEKLLSYSLEVYESVYDV